METNRKLWNQRQKLLRSSIEGKSEQDLAIQTFLKQHAMVHTVAVSGTEDHSFADELWRVMTEESLRYICLEIIFTHNIGIVGFK